MAPHSAADDRSKPHPACALNGVVTTTADHLPDDTEALKAALIETRAKLAGAQALIEHLQLVIAKMKRATFGPRSERSQRLIDSMLRRRGLPLALARIELDDDARVVDLDDPAVLVRRKLRPSRVATRRREVTQAQAREIYADSKKAAGLSWWSTYEAAWVNVTLFDRGPSHVSLEAIRGLSTGDAAVTDAADFLGLRRV